MCSAISPWSLTFQVPLDIIPSVEIVLCGLLSSSLTWIRFSSSAPGHMFGVIFIVLFSQYFFFWWLKHDMLLQPLCGQLVNPLRWDSFSSEVLWCILNLLLWLHPHPRWAVQVGPESLWVWLAWWGFDVYFAMGDRSLCQNRIGSVSARMNVMQPVTTQRTVLVWNINMHNTTAHKTPHGSVNRNKLCQGDSVDNPDIYGWKWDSQRWPIKRCNAKTLGCGAGCSFGIDVAVFQVLWYICCACHHFMLPGLLCEGENAQKSHWCGL